MRLIDALRVEPSSRIALVGSGGKTSALIRLSYEWAGKSIQAATAHFGVNQTGFAVNHYKWSVENNPDIYSINVDQKNIITGLQRDEIILLGIDPTQWKFLKKLADLHQIPVFLEADGSKTRPLKAPAEHEPPIPEWINHVVVSVGLSVLGKSLNGNNVHRPEIFTKLTGLKEGQPITEENIIEMLIHPVGGLQNIPDGARKTIMLNQVDTVADLSSLQKFEETLLDTFDSVIFCALQSDKGKYSLDEVPGEVIKTIEKTAGIILAAGNSKRMGQPKALLDWNGIPFVRACAIEAISAGLNPVYIIAGSEHLAIENAVSGLPVKVLKNDEWQTGQSSSIRVGVKALPKNIGSVVFQLVDQPHISHTLIRQLMVEHNLSLAPIILPEAGGRRANPVLFDRTTFSDLLKLQGDVGGRSIFLHYTVKMIPWNDEGILMDVDTPEDYARLLSNSQ
jgi:molybdenum cofactor cytidylyltransferase